MRQIYVGNIGFQITEASLRREFEAYGRVKEVQLGWNFALIDMYNEGAAKRAVSDLNSRTTWVLRCLALAGSGPQAA
jgi:RNA recognition motif-containing protein